MLSIFILVSSIDDSYYSSSANKKDIIKFAEKLLFQVEPNKSNRDRIILTIYSINDKIYRVRTGRYIRSILKDEYVTSIADSIKSYLKNNNYRKAFLSLFEDIKNCTLGNESSC